MSREESRVKTVREEWTRTGAEQMERRGQAGESSGSWERLVCSPVSVDHCLGGVSKPLFLCLPQPVCWPVGSSRPLANSPSSRSEG